MSGKAVGLSAAELPWLCPNTDNLIRIAETPASFAGTPIPADAALLLFLLRFTPPTAPPGTGLFCPSALASTILPAAAATLLGTSPASWTTPNCEAVKRCLTFSSHAVSFAQSLAKHNQRTSPERVGALVSLAPLGWLAIAAVDPRAADKPFDSATLPTAELQAEFWGLDQNAIARRLANRWRLPEWIGTALGNLCLPLVAAEDAVADMDLFVVAQLATHEAERRIHSLGLTEGADRAALLKSLKLDEASVDKLWAASVPSAESSSISTYDQNPHHVPLVANLLRMAAENRRRNGTALVGRLEARIDDLHRGFARVDAVNETRNRDQRLNALAELAAGAGHEINNPLAVISGNAQRLSRTEPDTERSESLHAIIRQTQRIAVIVRDLMQFARPPVPKPHRITAADLIHAVYTEQSPFAQEKNIRLEVSSVPASVFVRCDRGQIVHALGALVRNGIEAAAKDGWVRIGCTVSDDEIVTFAVEDSGQGLTEAALKHAFDPFYCGRSAGRGRGLGLPTAWQFARRNGGELRHDQSTTSPTRFVLVLPRSITLEFLDRQSA